MQDCFAFCILSGTVATRLSQSEHRVRFLEDPWIFSYSQSQVEQQIQDPRFSHGETNSTQLLSQRNTVIIIGRPEPSSRSCSQSYFRFAYCLNHSLYLTLLCFFFFLFFVFCFFLFCFVGIMLWSLFTVQIETTSYILFNFWFSKVALLYVARVSLIKWLYLVIYFDKSNVGLVLEAEVSKTEGRVGQTTNVVIGGTVTDDSTNEWLTLDQKVSNSLFLQVIPTFSVIE